MPTRLLLIEDNPGDALIFREKLNESNLDYELVHTQRLQEGLELIESESFDLILVDLSLPDASGLEAIVQVIDAAPDRPVIVLTGLDDANIAAQARQEGAIDYLVKWYHDGPSLARYVRYAIAQMRMQREGRMERPGVEGAGAAESPSEAARAEGTEPAEDQEQPLPPAGEAAPAPAPPGKGAVDPVRTAFDRCREGIMVVDSDHRVRYANDRARQWLGPVRRYPWPLQPGTRQIADDTSELVQEASPTRWEDGEAYVVVLRPAPESGRGDAERPAMLQMAEAALGYAAQAERRARWMSGLLRSALELEQQEARAVPPTPALVDLVDRIQMIARELHPSAMERGTPINVKASREKISARVDRQLVETLMRRVMLDAVLTAHSSGVDVEVSIAQGRPRLVVTWELSLPEWAALPSAARSLSRGLVERLAARVGAECDHREVGGRDLVEISFAAEAPAGG